jgi:uncharacterized protein
MRHAPLARPHRIRHIAIMPMPTVPDFTATSLDALTQWIESDTLPPVERWNPAHEGRIDIRIEAEGRWFHEGGEITRPAMVRAFSRILRRESDGGYALVTPAEKLAITVEDAPLLAVEARIERIGVAQTIAFRLNTDAMLLCGADHPLVLRDGPAGRLPYLRVTGSAERPVEARLTRSTFYQLAEIADADGCVWSGGQRFALADTD